MAIAEFPYLCIDDFRVGEGRPLPELCILSHMHEDHTVGLARKSYHGPPVYCTAATKAMVLSFRTNYGKGPLKYNHLRREIGGREILQALDLDKPYKLDYPGGALQVTLIDANHCPGAAMVLVQAAHGGPSVLFTGDVRCERWHLDALIHNPALFTYSKHLCDGPGRQWLSLYVDDTFLSHCDPFKSYGDNYDGILQLAALLKQYPKEVHFCIADRTTGYEEVLIALSQQLHTRVHMDAYFFAMYSAAALTSPLAAKLIERSSTELGAAGETRLHYCHKHNGCPMRDAHAPTVYFKPCNQPSQEDVQLQNMQLPFSAVRPSALRPFEGSSTIFLGPEQRYYKDTKSQLYYPLFPWFYFSRHSSFTELQGLRDLFHVTAVRSLHGVEIAALTLPPAASVKRSSSMVQEVSESRGSAQTKAAVAAAVRAHKAPSVNSGMLPIYKKQQHARAKRRRQNQRKSDEDDDTDADETERHEMLELLNRRSMREESKRKWRASILELEKQLDNRSDTQEFDKYELPGLIASLSPRASEEAEPAPHAATNLMPCVPLESAHKTDCAEDEHSTMQDTFQDAENSSLLSPPPSPQNCAPSKYEAGALQPDHRRPESACNSLSGELHLTSKREDRSDSNSDSCAGGELDDDEQVIDETPTSEALLAALEHQIRSDPSCWFSFTFDFVSIC